MNILFYGFYDAGDVAGLLDLRKEGCEGSLCCVIWLENILYGDILYEVF